MRNFKSPKKLTHRLALFNERRKYYLDFLRNLTPQIFLLTFALLSAVKIHSPPANSSVPALIFMTSVFSLGFLIAVYANTSTFFNECFGELRQTFPLFQEELRKKGYGRNRVFFTAVFYLIRYRCPEFLELIFAMILLQFVLAAQIVTSFFSAAKNFGA